MFVHSVVYFVEIQVSEHFLFIAKHQGKLLVSNVCSNVCSRRGYVAVLVFKFTYIAVTDIVSKGCL